MSAVYESGTQNVKGKTTINEQEGLTNP